MSIYSTGVALGAGLAFAFGAQAVALVGHLPPDMPVIGGLRPWQATFVIVGLPGLVVALLVALVVRDPRGAVRSAEAPSLLSGLGPFWHANRRLIISYVLGISALTGAGYASLTWLPAHFIRNFGWTPAETGTAIGLMLMSAGVAGALAAGAAASALARRGVPDAPIRVILVAAALHAPLTAAVTLVGSDTAAILLLAPAIFLSSAFVAVGPAAVQAVTPQPLRGRVAALMLMLTSLVGMVLGPVAVGALTSFLFARDTAVGLSLALVAGTLSAVGALCLLAALGPYRRAMGHR